MERVGVIGLGNMGRGMALSLRRAGFGVIGYDANADAVKTLTEHGVGPAASIQEVCEAATTIVLSLPDATVVEKVICGEGGILRHGKAQTLVIDTSTSHPDTTRKLAVQLADRDIRVIDAPVSGGAKGALNGQLTMVLGGEAADIARAEPVLTAMSAKRVHVGPVGAGNVTKIVNNLLCAAHLIIAGEAMRIAEAAGVPKERLLEGINAGSGRSGVTQTNYPTWILNNAFNSGFTMKLMRKDVRLAMALAEQLNLDLPLSGEVGRMWAASEATLADNEDFNRIV